MAGTRLAAQACFCIAAVVLSLFAWWKGSVASTPLPLSLIGEASRCTLHQNPMTIKLYVLLSPATDNLEGHDCVQCEALLRALALEDSGAAAVFRRAAVAVDTSAIIEDATIELLQPSSELLSGTDSSPAELYKWVHKSHPPVQHTSAIAIVCSEGSDEGLEIGPERLSILKLPCGLPSEQATTLLQALAEVWAAIVVGAVSTSSAAAADKFASHSSHSSSFHLSFTLLSEDPSQRKCEWNFQSLAHRFIYPTVDVLQHVADITYASRELAYAHISTEKPVKEKAGTGGVAISYLSSQNLSTFHYATASLPSAGDATPLYNRRRASNVGEGKGTKHTRAITDVNVGHKRTLDFTVFCPVEPLLFRDAPGGPSTPAFEIAGHGGVAVINPSITFSKNTTVRESITPLQFLAPASAFLTHVRTAVGLRGAGASLASFPCSRTNSHLSGACFPLTVAAAKAESGMALAQVSSPLAGLPIKVLSAKGGSAVSLWEVDALSRWWGQRRAIAALEALNRLVSLSESGTGVIISEEVAKNAKDSALLLLHAHTQADAQNCISKKNGHTRDESCFADIRDATEALHHAEAALESPDLLPPLYFRPDYVAAVFAPLVVPLVLPMFAGLVREWKRYKTKTAGKRHTVDVALAVAAAALSTGVTDT